MNRDHIGRVFPQVNDDRIRITGAPRFDYFTHQDRVPSKHEVLAYTGLPSESNLKILHGATTELYSFEYILAALAEAKASRALVAPTALYASVHPGGDMNRHQYDSYGAVTRYSFGRREKATHPNFSYLPTDEEIYMLVALFKHTDVLVNQSSTVAIESMACDVPVINVKYGKPMDWWGWHRSMVYRDFQQHYRYITEEGGTTIVKNKKRLIAAVNRYLENPAHEREQRAKTVRKMITYTDGSASKRLLDFAKELA